MRYTIIVPTRVVIVSLHRVTWPPSGEIPFCRILVLCTISLCLTYLCVDVDLVRVLVRRTVYLPVSTPSISPVVVLIRIIVGFFIKHIRMIEFLKVTCVFSLRQVVYGSHIDTIRTYWRTHRHTYLLLNVFLCTVYTYRLYSKRMCGCCLRVGFCKNCECAICLIGVFTLDVYC